MAANVHLAGSSSWPGGVAPWGGAQGPASPAALVGAAESTPSQSSREDSESSDSSHGIRPKNGAQAKMMAVAAVGQHSIQQRSGCLQPSGVRVHAAGAGYGPPSANDSEQKDYVEAEAGRGDHPNVPRNILLEAEIRSARGLNTQLQLEVAQLQTDVDFLKAHIKAQHCHIVRMHDKVAALETELKSARANTVGQAISKLPKPAAAISVEADPVSTSPSSPTSSTSAPTMECHPPSPGQDEQPARAALTAPGIEGNYALWDLRPGDACGSAAAPGAKTADKRGRGGVQPTRSGAPSPESKVTQLTRPAQNEAPISVARFSTTSTNVQVAPSPDPGSAESSRAGPAAPVVAQPTNDTSETTTAPSQRVSDADPVGNVGAVAHPPANTRKRRHSLRDFWHDTSSSNVDNAPPASNTRNHRHRAVRQQQQGTSLPPAGKETEGANSEPAITPATLQLEAAQANTADTANTAEIAPVVNPATTAAAIERGNPATETEPATPTGPQVLRPLILRRAMEGREGAEGRSSHLMDCAVCQDALPDGEAIGRCDECPRSYCSKCLKGGLSEQQVELGGLDSESRALLDGRQGDYFISRCPQCTCGRDREFSPPPQGTAPMDHLLGELLQHDLSLCFREPVDVDKHPDYVENIGRNAMMDLGTMSDKLKGKRYPRRRGPGQFLDDLNRIWKNCRRYAGCDELGKPHFGNTVPGIVRCALILEALTLKYCAAYMSDNQGNAAWQESTWDFYRQEQERANASARLKQLQGRPRTYDEVDTKPPLSGGGGVPSMSSPEESTSMASVENSSEHRNGSTRDESERDSSRPLQQATATSSATEGRKRSAAAMGGEAERSTQLGRPRRAARILVHAAAANSGSGGGGGTLKTGSRQVDKTQRQPPWSPLDRLCDLATTYRK